MTDEVKTLYWDDVHTYTVVEDKKIQEEYEKLPPEKRRRMEYQLCLDVTEFIEGTAERVIRGLHRIDEPRLEDKR